MPRVVDGTAAGDAFRAALAVALAEKQVGRRGARFVSRMEGLGRKVATSHSPSFILARSNLVFEQEGFQTFPAISPNPSTPQLADRHYGKPCVWPVQLGPWQYHDRVLSPACHGERTVLPYYQVLQWPV